MGYKVFVINPGSTSTKLGYFDGDKELFQTNVFHDAPELAKYPTINDQLPYRLNVILQFLKDNHIDLTGVDAIVGRGGSCYSVEGGVYEVSDQMLEDTKNAVNGVAHPANLGVQLAKELQKHFGGRVFTVDPPCVDEFQDLARVTGIDGVYRASHLHALNLKGTIKMHCEKMGEKYEEGNYIVCHIDGGISVSAHKHGRMVDGNDIAGGDGPFTPTRIGSIAVADVIDYMKDKTPAEVRKLCTRGGGFTSYFGTSNSDTVHAMVEKGDPKATRVWNAMIYNISKQIGAMATVLHGDVKAIVCGGGLLRFEDLKQSLIDECGWIAPFYFYPGEVENEAMAAGAIRVLKGEEQPKVYTGKPVWNGFKD